MNEHNVARACLGAVTLGVAILVAGVAPTATADDAEDVDVTITVDDTVPQLLTLSYARETAPMNQGFLLDGASGAAGSQMGGLLGRLTVTDARASATGWDLTTTVTPFSGPAGASIPVESIGTQATLWDPEAPPPTGIFGASAEPDYSAGPRGLVTATADAGLGSFDLDMLVLVDVPYSASLGSYTSTFTIDLVGN